LGEFALELIYCNDELYGAIELLKLNVWEDETE
jgi:hypothetical protein